MSLSKAHLDISSQIAVEHLVWAAERGMTPRDVIEAVGRRWPGLAEPNWDDAKLVLTIKWRSLAATLAQEARCAA